MGAGAPHKTTPLSEHLSHSFFPPPPKMPSRANPSFFACHLPDDLIVQILSHLPACSLGAALTSCRAFAGLSNEAWRAACFRRWPRWSAIAEHPDAEWRRQYELLSLRACEATADVAAIKKRQTQVTEGHRAILTEWLCEVSLDWQLDNAVVFKAVAYLDCYLAQTNVEALSRFQLLGLSCLRAALGDARKPAMIRPLTEEEKQCLDPVRFSYISDDTYTPAEVEEFTEVVAAAVPVYLKTSPNAKMFLRTFWQRATLMEVVCQDEMHIYTLASFLLQLSLLDLACSAFPASKLAAGALSVALAAFGKPAWPVEIQQFGSYLPEDLEDCKGRLIKLQATLDAGQLRPLWKARNENHGYDEFKQEWDRVLAIFAARSQLLLTPGATLAPRAQRTGQPARTVEAMQID